MNARIPILAVTLAVEGNREVFPAKAAWKYHVHAGSQVRALNTADAPPDEQIGR